MRTSVKERAKMINQEIDPIIKSFGIDDIECIIFAIYEKLSNGGVLSEYWWRSWRSLEPLLNESNDRDEEIIAFDTIVKTYFALGFKTALQVQKEFNSISTITTVIK